MEHQPKKVFIFNGYDHYGGAYMLYQIGRICHEVYGADIFIAQIIDTKIGKRRFHYPYDFPVVTIEEMNEEISESDLFICNPAHSRYQFGKLLNCRKLMYLQGVTSYTEIDSYFDHYVSVSEFVRKHVKEKFGMDTPVIHPFINHDIFHSEKTWIDRKDEILVSCYKRETVHALANLIKEYKKGHPQQHLRIKKIGNLSQEKLAELLGQHKIYLTLSPIEGFGLIPLEAMASGTTVAGFDGYGGRDYFTKENAFVVKSGEYGLLIEKLNHALNNPMQAQLAAAEGKKTVKRFTYENYKHHWTEYLEKIGFK